MTISWYGLGSFKITGKDITIITDPFGSDTGLSAVRGGADVIVCSNPKLNWCNNFSSITGSPFIVLGPGEYDIKEALLLAPRPRIRIWVQRRFIALNWKVSASLSWGRSTKHN